jgi:cytochrome bd-type quinol oxidase subunit 2
MATDTATGDRKLGQSALLSFAMLLLSVGGIAYVIVRGGVLEERYGKPNLLAHTNLYEEFIVAAIFFLAPFVGACSALRMARAPERGTKVVGWLLVVMFSLFLLQAGLVYLSEYQSYVSHR